MELGKADDPNDDIVTRSKKRWQSQQIAAIDTYQKLMSDVHNVAMAFNLKLDFDKAARTESTVFLASLITDVKTFKNADPEPGYPAELVGATYDNHFDVVYVPHVPHGPEKFLVPNLTMNYMAEGKVEAEQAIIEKVKAAMLLAHHAKIAGWTHVNFGNTQDHLERYILKMACHDLGLNTDAELVDVKLIPDNKAFNVTLWQKAYDLHEEIKTSIFVTVAERRYAKAGNDNASQDNASEDIADFDEEAPAPRAA